MRGKIRFAALALLAVSGAHAGEIRMEISYSVRNDTSRPLREIIADIGPVQSRSAESLPLIENQFLKAPQAERPALAPGFGVLRAPKYQTEASREVTPPTIASFNGLGVGNGANGMPPDTNGDVSPTHYIQWINTSWGIFNKTTGTQIGLTVAGNSFWNGFGGDCQNTNAGDPLAIWDDTAERWVMSQFVTRAPFKQCVAVSATSDPLGAYHRYEFTSPIFGDYPHIGVWTDEGGTQNAYLMVTHDFSGSPLTFQGASFVAMERDKMLAGQPAGVVRFSGFNAYGTQPIHLDGQLKAPTGACPTFVHFDEADSSYLFWDLCLNWTTPGSSTITNTPQRVLSGSTFRPNFAQVPQAGTAQRLDGFGSNIMFRAAARTFPAGAPFTTALVINHHVLGPADQGAIKWVQFDLQQGAGTPAAMTKSIVDEGTFAPDTSSRWMGSVAIDKNGNIGVGYTRSSSTTNPTIMLTSRKLGDAPGVLRDETACTPPTTGSQTSTSGRWGDYSSMSVDPSDDCTFWHTNEWYPSTSSGSYQTRICSFVLDGCGEPNFSVVSDSPKRIEQCALTTTTDPSWNLRAGALFGFNGNVVFSATGTPVGSTATFSPANATAPAATVFTLTNGAALPSGEYELSLIGTSGALVRSVPVSFGLSSAPAAAPALSSPANAASNVSQRPALSWDASPGALAYFVQIADDPAFANVIASATLTTTQWTPSVTLDPTRTYYWRVRTSNYCGDGTFSAARSFVTGTAGVCGAGQSRVVVFSDDVETGTNGWTTAGTGGTAWSRQAAVAGTRMSTMVWRVQNNTVTSDRQLVSPVIAIPGGATDVTLSYDTHHSFEIDGPAGCWDAGSLEVSTDGGSNWTYLDDSRMFTDPYVGTISDGAPLAGRGGWCHLTVQPFSFLSGFEDTAQLLPARNIVDLSGFAGQNIQLRFRATSDSNTAATAPNGWSIDNIRVQRCQ